MNTVKVTFDKVKALYPDCRVLGVLEAYFPNKGWVLTPFHGIGNVEENILRCHAIGATSVNLIIRDNQTGERYHSDYKIKELIQEVFRVSYYILNREGKECVEATKKPVVDICEEFYQQTAEKVETDVYSPVSDRFILRGFGFQMVVNIHDLTQKLQRIGAMAD